MKRFLQLHVLTPYAPSNLNRDDMGKPKSALFGGANRLRISSQCLKRTWRTSDVFSSKLSEAIGIRTRNLKYLIVDELKNTGIAESDINKKAEEWIKKIYNDDKKSKEKPNKKNSESDEDTSEKSDSKNELIHISLNEIQTIKKLIQEGKPLSEIKQADILYQYSKNEAVDIALFGRMIAKAPDYNIEAAAQVAHAITTHRVAEETDYFTAVDDLNKEMEITGSGYIDAFEFGSGLFYHYICINREQLVKNLGGNESLAKKAIEALLEAIVSVSPGGKQNSFAALSRAAYVLAETGDQQPRSLALAFFNPVQKDLLNGSIAALKTCRDNLDSVYGKQVDATTEMVCTPEKTTGTLAELKKFVVE